MSDAHDHRGRGALCARLLQDYYKNTHLKQYHKEGRALRTETTNNNAYDFGVGRRLKNLPALRQIGVAANRRVLEVERIPQTQRHRLTTFGLKTALFYARTYQRFLRPGLSELHDPRTGQSSILALSFDRCQKTLDAYIAQNHAA